MVTLVGQLRDAQASNENLRMQITILQNQIHQLERARDLAELRREFTQPPPAPLGHTAAGPRFKNIPDVVRVNGQVKYYSEDEEKENRPPAPSGSRLPGDNDAQPSDPAQSGGAEFPSGPSTSRAEA
ncbi:hypothetical protein C8R46DRAFT_412595 [Mycena filopes]|nr:hypothetical protein C8R46DRAFT_412595 [Mycena filopes]